MVAPEPARRRSSAVMRRIELLFDDLRRGAFGTQRSVFDPMPSGTGTGKDGGGSSAARALRLLALLAREGRPLRLAELAARLALPKATAHRICEQLIGMRFLARDVQERSFVAGPSLHQLAYDTLKISASSAACATKCWPHSSLGSARPATSRPSTAPRCSISIASDRKS